MISFSSTDPRLRHRPLLHRLISSPCSWNLIEREIWSMTAPPFIQPDHRASPTLSGPVDGKGGVSTARFVSLGIVAASPERP